MSNDTNFRRGGPGAALDLSSSTSGPTVHALRRGRTVLERIAEGRTLKLVKVNYDEEQGLADRYGVESIRT